MKKFNIYYLILLSFLMLVICSAAPARELSKDLPENVGISSDRLKRITRVLHQYVNNEKLSGGVILIVRRGKIAYHEAFGLRDRESGSPMRENTIFRIASQTKALISVGIMILQEEGRLLIQDPVGKYLPEFQETTVAIPKEDGLYEVVKAKRPITIRDLLTHTAGIGYGEGIAADRWAKAGIQGWYFADRDEPIGATVSHMAALPFDAQPGESFVYGYSTDILGALIERVTGETLDNFLDKRIFIPLKMQDTHFYLPKTKKDRLAVVYSSKEAGNLGRAQTPGGSVGQGAYIDGPKKSFSGGAGLLSTATDYAKFLQMMLNGGELNGESILSFKTVELMTMNHIDKIPLPDWFQLHSGTGFGLGFFVREDIGISGSVGSPGQYGWGGAYHSMYWVDPKEQLVVVYLTQLIPARDIDDLEKIFTLVYQTLKE